MLRRLAILPVGLALALGLAGCSGLLAGGGPADPGTASAEANNGWEAWKAFAAYRNAEDPAEARRWVCIAANLDMPEAQEEIARLHWHGFWEPTSPFRHDAFRAYVWSRIALSRRQPVGEMERLLGGVLPGEDRWRADALAREWQPDPAVCDYMELSEYYAIPAGAAPTLMAAELEARAEAGDARAAFVAYRWADSDDEARRWLCIAANLDMPEAQAEIGRLHHDPPDGPAGLFAPDAYNAFVWSVIAVHRHRPFDEMEQQPGEMVAGVARWRAMAQAVSWRPDPADCDDMAASPYYRLP